MNAENVVPARLRSAVTDRFNVHSILIFGHVPPPHHGQSYMVAQLLEELQAHPHELRVFHVDSRISESLEDVGRVEPVKVFRLLRYCGQAIRLRRRHGPMVLYYVPAPAKRGALYRDWLVMSLCRVFFRDRLLLHWHAVGLGAWIGQRPRSLTALLTRRLLGHARLSLVLAHAVGEDAAVFFPKQIRVLPNGIPDPAPDFAAAVLPARIARQQARPRIFRVLFLAHCTREKGLYDALDGVFQAQRRLQSAEPTACIALTVAGQFLTAGDQRAFEQTLTRVNEAWQGDGSPPAVEHVGFVTGETKDRLFRESDCFCFPTYYRSEVMPVTLIEALAYGLPIVATRWRAIPEMLPEAGCFLVETGQAEQVAAALLEAMQTDAFAALREHFLSNFQREIFGHRFRSAVAECFPADGSSVPA